MMTVGVEPILGRQSLEEGVEVAEIFFSAFEKLVDFAYESDGVRGMKSLPVNAQEMVVEDIDNDACEASSLGGE